MIVVRFARSSVPFSGTRGRTFTRLFPASHPLSVELQIRYAENWPGLLRWQKTLHIGPAEAGYRTLFPYLERIESSSFPLAEFFDYWLIPKQAEKVKKNFSAE